MKNLVFLLSVLLIGNWAQAQSFKVIKISGNKAIVEVDNVSQIEVNNTYTTGDGSGAAAKGSSSSKSSYKRDYGVGLNFNFSSAKSDAPGAVSTENMSLSGLYLWNFKKYEIGPILSYSNTKAGGATATTTSFGGQGFYNFNENKVGTEGVFSIVGLVQLGSTSVGGASSSTTGLQVGPNYRWFILSGDHCISASALITMVKGSAGGVDTTTSGFALTAGISTYF